MKNSGEPDRFVHERALLARGVRSIAGVDEAGRGPLAGPVMAAAVILPLAWIQNGMPESLRLLNDSKQLSERQRDAMFEELTRCPEVFHGIARLDSAEVDRWNILAATHRAMNQALEQLKPPPDHVLVDGLPVPTLDNRHTALVKGDSLSYSIAAASVLAKVTRDRVMIEYDRQYPEYGFAGHKGYGTARHLEALNRHGPCPIHRRSFAPVRQIRLPLAFPQS
jgi:ribonuclease HII